MFKKRGWIDNYDVMDSIRTINKNMIIEKIKTNPRLYRKKYLRLYNLLIKNEPIYAA